MLRVDRHSSVLQREQKLTRIDTESKEGAGDGLALRLIGCAATERPGPTGGAVVKSARLGWYTKKVVAKRTPETLLAEDGTICRVAPDRFSNTATGAAVYCNWQ
jgi:hypothetical protein